VRWRTIFKYGTLAVTPRGPGALCQLRVHSQVVSLGPQHATRIMKVCHGCQGLVGCPSAASQHKHQFVFGSPVAAVGGTPPAACLSGVWVLGVELRDSLARSQWQRHNYNALRPLRCNPPANQPHRYRAGCGCRVPTFSAAGSFSRIHDKALARVPSSISTPSHCTPTLTPSHCSRLHGV
jgi:hypothetical protein